MGAKGAVFIYRGWLQYAGVAGTPDSPAQGSPSLRILRGKNYCKPHFGSDHKPQMVCDRFYPGSPRNMTRDKVVDLGPLYLNIQ